MKSTKMKIVDIVLPIVFFISIAAPFLVNLSWPVEKDVACGNTYITQERAKESYIEWNHETRSCDKTTGACTLSGTTLLRPVTPPLSYQMWIFIGTVFSLVMFFLVIEPSVRSEITESTAKNRTKERKNTPKNTAYAIRFVVLILTGLCITTTLAIFLGNVSGSLSPTFIDSCKPNPSVNDLCKEALLQGKEYVKVKCTTTPTWNDPYRSSSFPRYISMLSYLMCTVSCWAIISSIRSKDLWGWLILGFALISTVSLIIGIGCAAYTQLEAFIWPDIVSGFLLGLVMAVVFVGMMFVIYPRWIGPPEVFLPQTTKDLSPDVMQNSKTTPASTASLAGKL